MVIACFFGKCGWLGNHVTGYAVGSLTMDDNKEILVELIAYANTGAYKSGPDAGYWIAVVPKSPGAIKIDAAPRLGDRYLKTMRIAEIKAVGEK